MFRQREVSQALFLSHHEDAASIAIHAHQVAVQQRYVPAAVLLNLAVRSSWREGGTVS